MRTSKIGNKAQNFVEYTLILGIVGVALFGMQTYFKRGIQSVIKVVADDLGPQGEPFKSQEKKKEREAVDKKIKAKYYPKGNTNTYYSYKDDKYLPIENKYTYTSTSSEDVTIENKGQGNIVRKTNKGKASSDDISY